MRISDKLRQLARDLDAIATRVADLPTPDEIDQTVKAVIRLETALGYATDGDIITRIHMATDTLIAQRARAANDVFAASPIPTQRQ